MKAQKVPGQLVLGALLLLAGCSDKQDVRAAAPAGSGRPPAPVVAAVVEQRDIPIQIKGIGNAEAYQTVQIRSQVSGQIERVYFKEGQDVRKGQLLFSLDKRPFQAELDKALGALQHDEAQAANFAAQAARYGALEQQGVISREQADEQRTQAKAAASAVLADKAAVEAARVQLQFTDIKAPLNARTGALQINAGNLVKANDTPFLVQLDEIEPIYVTFSVPETFLNQVQQYAARHLKVLAYPKGSSTDPSVGYLTFIDNAVDTQTGTVKLKATFANADRRLWPGRFQDVVLNLSTQHNAVVVPTVAVQAGQQGDYVYVITQQETAESRPIVTAGTFQDLTLVAKGLSPGERVVANGQLRVAPNGKVIVQSTLPSPNPQATVSGTAGGAAQ